VPARDAAVGARRGQPRIVPADVEDGVHEPVEGPLPGVERQPSQGAVEHEETDAVLRPEVCAGHAGSAADRAFQRASHVAERVDGQKDVGAQLRGVLDDVQPTVAQTRGPVNVTQRVPTRSPGSRRTGHRVRRSVTRAAPS